MELGERILIQCQSYTNCMSTLLINALFSYNGNYVEGVWYWLMGRTDGKVVHIIMGEDLRRYLVTIVLSIVFGTPITQPVDRIDRHTSIADVNTVFFSWMGTLPIGTLLKIAGLIGIWNLIWALDAVITLDQWQLKSLDQKYGQIWILMAKICRNFIF